MPTVDQVKGTMPYAFEEKYPKTLLETPTDLQFQSSTSSNYKHHNTMKVLVGCTPDGAIDFVSELYMDLFQMSN